MSTEHQPAPHADRDGPEVRYPEAVRSLVNAAKAEAKAQRTIADLRAEVAEKDARIERIIDQWRGTNRECIKHWNRADKAEAALARVEALHPRGETWYEPGEGMVTTEDDRIEDGCQECRTPWPCATITTMRGLDVEAVRDAT